MEPARLSARSEFLCGTRAVLPAATATAAWGIVTGVAMVKAGLSASQAIGMTVIVFAGSAQLAATPLIVAGASAPVILLTAVIINLRFIIYGAALSTHFRGASALRKLGLGYLSADISFAVFMQRMASEPERPFADAFLLGAAGANWVVWQIASLLGIVLAGFIPTRYGLGFAGTLALAALAVPLVRTVPARLGVVVTALLALATSDWPLKLGLFAATLAGIATALLAELWSEHRTRHRPRGADRG
jgi:predicted branched-subunit amino acid permease